MIKFLKTPLMLAVALFVFAACERDDMELEQAVANTAISEGETNVYFDDIDRMAEEAMKAAENGRVLATTSVIPGCAAVTHDTQTRTSTIDFGTGCEDAKGNIRKGKIIISRTGGRYIESGSSHTTTLEAYSVNNIAVAGTRTVTNVTTANDVHPQFTVVLSGGKVTWPDATFALREVDRRRSWIRAELPANDEWHLTGTAGGTNRAGQAYLSTIKEALVLKLSCISEGVFIPAKGITYVERPEKPVLVVDYGNGSCDNQAVVSVNGRSRTITVSQ